MSTNDFNDLSAELTIANAQSIARVAEQRELAQLRRERDALLALLEWSAPGRMRTVMRRNQKLYAMWRAESESSNSPVELCAKLGIPGFEEE